jgi:hypothetical protein
MNICKKLFGKKEKSWIRFYSVEPGVAEVYPIIPASRVKRSWMDIQQPLDPDNGPMFTKNCPGIKKLVSTGWIVTAPADFIIETNGDGKTFRWKEARKFTRGTPGWDNYVGFHNQHQTELVIDNPSTTLKSAVKLDTPWRIEASDDMMLLQVPVTYNNESRFTAATGLYDPRFGHVVNVQLFWHVFEGETLIKAGTPLCQYIPVKRDFLNINNHDVIIDTATPEDMQTEKKFNYATSCEFLQHDNVGSRLRRVVKALTK